MLVSVTVHSKELSTWRKTWFGLIAGFFLLFVFARGVDTNAGGTR